MPESEIRVRRAEVVQELVEALEFYGEYGNWGHLKSQFLDSLCGQDYGSRARQVLYEPGQGDVKPDAGPRATFGNLMERAREKVAVAWCTPKTEHKEMDVELADAFAAILAPYLASEVFGDMEPPTEAKTADGKLAPGSNPSKVRGSQVDVGKWPTPRAILDRGRKDSPNFLSGE